jgi:hypothetical protein
MNSFYSVMPDPDPAASVATSFKSDGFRVKPGMTKNFRGLFFNYDTACEDQVLETE